MNAVNGFASTWLPLQQEHDVGRKAFFDLLRGDLHRGVQWTDDGIAGDFAMSPWQLLPAGDYTALLQVWSEHADRPAGQLIAEDDAGRVLAAQPVVTGPAEFGDWRRELTEFRLGAATRVRVRFNFSGDVTLWTGAMHLTRGGRRPVFIIGHNRNTPEQVDQALARGANAIEVDLSYRDGRIMAAEVPPLPGWTDISEADVWLRHMQGCRDRWAFIYVDCKLHQIPNDDFYRYGENIAGLFRGAGMDPTRCMFSIPDDSGIDIHRAVKEHGFRESSFAIDGIDNNQPVHANPEDWAAAAARYELEVIGMGRAAIEIVKPLALWWDSVTATVEARDAGRPYPKNVIFWSLHEKDGMRKILDLGVDGIIADREDQLREVLEEEPYRRFCRRAEPGDWDPSHAFGVDA